MIRGMVCDYDSGHDSGYDSRQCNMPAFITSLYVFDGNALIHLSSTLYLNPANRIQCDLMIFHAHSVLVVGSGYSSDSVPTYAKQMM